MDSSLDDDCEVSELDADVGDEVDSDVVECVVSVCEEVGETEISP